MKGEKRKDNKDIRDSQDTYIKRHTDTLQKNLTNWREAYSSTNVAWRWKLGNR